MTPEIQIVLNTHQLLLQIIERAVGALEILACPHCGDRGGLRCFDYIACKELNNIAAMIREASKK